MLINKAKKPSYYLITLLALDPDDPTKSKMYELDPRTVAEGVFMDKECKIPAPITDPQFHLTEEMRAAINLTMTEGSYVVLDANGWVPMKYMDKHIMACYYEFENVADMLANNDFDPVKHHGRLVMVRNFFDDPDVTDPEMNGMWAIYRLTGNYPRYINSWTRVFFQAHFREYVRWNQLDHGFQSTVLEIDKMVRDSHVHVNMDILRDLEVNDYGQLVYHGQVLMYREEFIATGILTSYPYENMRVQDFGHDVTYRGDHEPDDRDSSGKIMLHGDVSGYYENNTELVEPGAINVTSAEKMNRFFKNCINLKTIPFMDTAAVLEFEEFCSGCTSLENITTLAYHNARTMARAFYGCTSLETLYPMELRNCEDISYLVNGAKNLSVMGKLNGDKIKYATRAFENCESLRDLPKVNLSQVEDLSYICRNCTSMESADLNSKSATNLDHAFDGCSELKRVSINVDSCTTALDIFRGCSKLEDVTIEGNLRIGINFSETNISLESATAIVDNLKYIDTPTYLVFTDTPGSYVNSISVAMAQRKNWYIVR